MCWVLLPSALIAVCLLAFGSFFTYYFFSDDIEENATARIRELKNAKDYKGEKWFGDLGCFDVGEPWSTFLRPVPPPMGPEENPVIVYFHTWRDKSKSYIITVHPEVHLGGAPFDGRRPTAVIIHGFKVNTTYDWIRNLKNAYLNNVAGNVLLADWGPGSACNILQASSNTRVIARLIVRLLNHLVQKRALRREMIHLIGHSLGAHVASYVAKEMPGIPRLTALDPAQPAFEGYPKEVRLDKSDAAFVEVVHTNAKPFVPHLGFGMVKPHGHVDFYFNDGGDQPGCTVPDEIPKINNIRDAVRFPIEYDINTFTCSHGRAHEYLVEAYNSANGCVFWGRRAVAKVNTAYVSDRQTPGLYSNFSVHTKRCSAENCIPFGLESINSPLRGVFVVMTNSHPPFCVLE